VKIVDPADGKPIRYRTEEGAALVWCCGLNGKDDGGVLLRDIKKNPDEYNPFSYDFGYRLDLSNLPMNAK